MWDHARIRLHQGKTQLWNRGGVAPEGWERLTAADRMSDPSAVVWKGEPSLPASELGLRILGTPLGHPEHEHDQLRRASADHRLLLERSPGFSFCAGTRANYLLRSIARQMALEFAANHTVSLRTCLQRILGAEIPPESWEVAVLPLSLGGLGLRSGPRVSPAAYWSSWADFLVTTTKRQPAVSW